MDTPTLAATRPIPPVRKRFAYNLKALRLAMDRSQEEMAVALDVKRSSYSGYENGYAEPNIEVLARIQGYFNVGMDAMLEGDLYALSTYDLRALHKRCEVRSIIKRVVQEETAVTA